MKLKRVLSAVLAGLMMVTAVPSATQMLASAAAPKRRVSVHDPSVFKDKNGTYYVFGSHIDAAKSTDLQNWTRFTNGYATTNNVIFGNLSQNLAGAFAWAGENLEDCAGGFSVWAPDVIYNPDYVNKDGSKGAYMMYFCTTSTYMRSVLAFGVSQNPEGPYQYVDTLIYSGFTSNDSYATSSTKNVNRKYTSTNIDELMAAGKVTWNDQWFSGTNFNNGTFPNAIDPTIYYDKDGTMYMCYGSWSGGIFSIELDPATGKCIHPKSGTTADGRLVDSYFGTKISGGHRKSGEGPFIEYNPDTDYYYLWVTYGGLTATGGYNMRVFRSKDALGPYVDPAGNAAVLGSNTNLDSVGLKVMGNYKFSSLSTAYMACGHNSVLRDDDGRWYLLNHARFNTGNEFHEVRVHSMYFNSEGWPVVAPYEYSGDVMAEFGYEESDIVGSYEFINHGTDTSGNVHNFSSIQLNADGTISGAESGTWQQAEDSSAAVINVGGRTYHGYFLAAQDETNQDKVVMSFTAVGNNNQTVWGAKTVAYNGTPREGKIDYTNTDSSLIYNPDSVNGASSVKTIGDTALLNGVSYQILNKNSGMAISLADSKTAAGTNVQQWSKSADSTKEWRLIAEADGYCRIVSMADEAMCITVDGSDATDGLNISLQKYSGADNQLWKFVKCGSYYGIVSKCSGDAAGLDVFEWSTENGGNINQWEYWEGDCQLWSVKPVYPKVNAGQYTIRNLNSSKWLSTESGNVIQSDDAQVWEVKANNDGTYSLFDADGKALTVENGDATDGNNVSMAADAGSAAQKFVLQCNRDGSYALLTVVSNNESCLDVYEISTESGANICQWDYWGGDGQKFVLEPAAKPDEVDPPVTETKKGDVNCDGDVKINDVILLNRFLAEDSTAVITEQGMINAECDDAEGVNGNDSIAILKMLAGLA